MSEQQSQEQSIYGADALVSDGTLTDAELALLEGNDSTIMDSGSIVEVSLHEEEAEEEEGETQEGDTEGTGKESEQETKQETPEGELQRAREALGEITEDLTTKGVNVDEVIQEFSKSGQLSPETYTKLAEAGYSKTVVNSIIAGQRAAAESFNTDIINSAGGSEAFTKIAQYGAANSPELVQAYNSAVERGDANSAKAILQAISKERTAKLGTSNKQLNGKPAAPVSNKPQGFASEDEMVKAINDRRYRTDQKYTREVEQKIAASNF